MLAEDQVRRKNTIAKTRMDRKLLCPGTLARRYGAKKNAFFRAERAPALRNTHRGDFPGGGRAAVAGRHARTATGLARGRVTGPTYFAEERLETGDPKIARRRLGSIESNLNPAGVERIKRSVAQREVTEGFQQAAGDILQAPEQLQGCSSKLGRRGAQQAADLQHLQDDVRDL
jgi:hypothetical protein